MSKFMRALSSLLLVFLLVACGGGGGSPGTPVTGGGGIGGSTTKPQITLELRDSTNAVTVSVTTAGATTLRATLLPVSGFTVANRLMSFTADADKLVFPQGNTALTDANGVAQVLVTPASLTATGAGTIAASAVVGSTTLTGRLDFQLSAVNLAMSTLNLGTSSLAAFGNRSVSVTVNANGVPAVSPVPVAFTASCGTIEPVSVLTNASGIASTTYKADGVQGCGGANVTITASAAGTTPVNGSLAVTPAPATNLQFVSATPETIYLAGSGGATQSQVRFRVVNATGGPLQGADVRLSLINAATDVSIDFLGSTAAVVKTTNLAGEVTVPVFSGAVPTPLQVRAVLVSNPAIETTSSLLTVASGRAAQARVSLAASIFALEGANIDGNLSRLTFSMADRQGNPVPDGTVVNFVSEGGVVVPPTCVTVGGSSRCAVDLRSQNPRPANGRVTVLAYVQGEEDFVDTNFNNRYDPNEPFTDLGNAYRDDDESGDHTLGEFAIPRSGAAVCAGGYAGRENTCDGVWGQADVRSVHVLVFSTSGVTITNTSRSAGTLVATVADFNGNSPATGSTITAAYSGAGSCSVDGVFPKVVANQLTPVVLTVTLKECVPADVIRVTVTAPSGLVSQRSFSGQPAP